jgi:hypothetical protein
VSPTIFNLMVDAVIREWERLLLLKGIPLGKIRELVAVFYTDDGLIAARSPKKLQTAIDLLTGLFGRVGLQTNTKKTEVMTFLPGKIRTSLSDTAYRARMDDIFRGEHKGRKVECSECGKLLAVGSLAKHQADQHDIFQSFVLEGEKEEAAPPPQPRAMGRHLLPLGGGIPLPRAGLPARAGRQWGAGLVQSARALCLPPQDSLSGGRGHVPAEVRAVRDASVHGGHAQARGVQDVPADGCSTPPARHSGARQDRPKPYLHGVRQTT